MSISTADVKAYQAAANGGSPNGGRQSWVQVVSSLVGNLYPEITESEQTAGFDLYRKLFRRFQDASDQSASTVRHTLGPPTDADDAVYMFEAASMTDEETDLTGSERLYGSGYLNADVSAGATQIKVLLEDPTKTIFADGDLILIDDGTNTDWLTITGTPSLSGSELTIDTTTQVLHNYATADSTVVYSVVESGTVEASISGVVETTTSGTFDEASVVPHDIGSEYDTITLTFTSATAFDAAGANLGALGSGTVSSSFAPNNPSSPGPGSALFTIPSAVWGGTWATGETVVFVLNPPATALWLRRIAAAGASSAPGNTVTLTTHYE